VNKVRRLVLRKEALSLFITTVTMFALVLSNSPPATSSNVARLLGNSEARWGYAPPPTYTYNVSNLVTDDGVFTQDIVAASVAGEVMLTIDEGTKAITAEGEPLPKITIDEMIEPPPPPEEANIISLTYDLGPAGATFDPPITLAFTYDPDDIPEGISEEHLVIAMWDKDAGEWVKLEGCTVDPVTCTITAPVSHFTAFTVIAPTIPPPEEEEVEVPTSPIDWWLIGGIIAGVVVIGILVYFLWWVRRYDYY
jgi:hypothetical protein